MKRKPYTPSIPNALLAALIPFFCIGCIITGFELEATPASYYILLPILLIFALLCDFSMSRRKGFWIFAIASAALCLFFAEDLMGSIEKLLYHLSWRYHRAYGWGYIRWGTHSLSLYSFTPAFALLGCLVIIPTLWALGRRKWVGFALLPGFLPLVTCFIVTDTTPATPFLLPLLAGYLLIALTQLIRKRDMRQNNRMIAVLLVPVLLFTFVLSVFSDDPHVQQAQAAQIKFVNLLNKIIDSGGQSNNGLIDVGGAPAATVDLSDIGPLNPSDKKVMTVRAEHSGLFYLRGQAYDTYTGTSWEASLDTTSESGWPTITDAPLFEASITTIYNLDLRYFPYYVQDEHWTAHLENGEYANPNRKKSYTFTYAIPADGEVSLELPLSEAARTNYTQLPQDTLQAALEILDELFGSTSYTEAEKVEIITDYVQNSASYDLKTKAMPDSAKDFALWFLTESDTGYCVHFASAATVLLRAAGIPARYVSGYISYTVPGVDVPVTGEQAHAWVEYYSSSGGQGWTVLEATPGAEDLVEPPTTEPTVPSETTQPEETTLPEETTQPEETEESTALTRPTNTLPTETPSQTPVEIPEWVDTVLWILLALALLFVQFSLRLRLRNRWLNKGDHNNRALRRWKYVRYLAWLTKQKRPDRLRFLAEKAAYSQHTLTKPELQEFDQWIGEAHKKLLRKPWPIKILLQAIFAIK